MEKDGTLKILNYYLEYEIYNLANSTQIKTDMNNCYIIKEKIDAGKVLKELNRLKQNKIRSVTEKFVGKKVQNKEALINDIIKNLDSLNSEQTNKIQVTLKIKLLMEEKIKKLDSKVAENFANQLCDIKANNEFWLYSHNISFINKNSKVAQKKPIFIFKCELQDEKIMVLDANISSQAINTILMILLEKEIADISIEYEEPISKYSKEIKKSIDGGDIEHIVDLFYAKLAEYVDASLTRENVKMISHYNNFYSFNAEHVMSLDELTDDAIKNIKEDIELLRKLVGCDNYIPNLLNKYINGTNEKKNINDGRYKIAHMGSYKSVYAVGQPQYKITNSISDNDLIAVEGPPGTGKTSLLKEIIANKIVERANFILENWNQNFIADNYYGNTYYRSDWFNKNSNIIKSIVVSSKNGEAIENVGNEIDKETKYMLPISRKYNRTQIVNGTKIKEPAQYKGLVCLPLGKQNNIQDFKDFLYKRFLPILEKLQNKEKTELFIEDVKNKYQAKLEEVKEYKNFLLELNKIKEPSKYFYGLNARKDLVQIENRLKEDRECCENKIQKIKLEIDDLNKKLSKIQKEIDTNNSIIEKTDEKIQNAQEKIIEYEMSIKDLEKQKIEFEKINRNLFTKAINYKKYKSYKNIEFEKEIARILIEKTTENKELDQYIANKGNIENEIDKLKNQCEEIETKLQELQTELEENSSNLNEINLINKFNSKNEKKYWNYQNIMGMYCGGYFNKLNEELFLLALKLNEAYIIKNGKEISENLKLFMPEGQSSYICQKFYDSSDIYNADKQEIIRNLWNTLFLCFPVVTTTLDSLCKRCFHLIPEYIDLELIDEAGQILPHNVVTALYRAKKAVIVGDIKQIEPIYNNVNKNFNEYQNAIGEKFENIKIEENSIQALASKNTDILSDGENIILNEHYRCERNIINFSNQNVYENKLNMNVEDKFDKPFFNNMIALDVRGKRTRKDNQNGSKNENKVEAEACIQAIKYIKEQDKSNPSIAIVTPFREQKRLLESRLEREGLTDIKIGTVHAFQGKEKDYVLFTPTLDAIEPKWAIKFIGDKYNMLNVAVTRAKKQFIYVGNVDVAERSENYIAKLIKYIKANGLVYSLYDIENSVLNKNFSERILQVLQPELEIANDNIGLYIQNNFKCGTIIDAKQHYDLLMYILKNTKKELLIMSPWLRKNVINEEFMNEIKRLKANGCHVKIIFGYKNGNKNVNGPDEIANELMKRDSLGYAKPEEVKEIVSELYNLLGKENFVYYPPLHAKIIIVDDEYMFMGSHNWLSNAGKTEEKKRTIEGTIITTSSDSISYTKEELFS